MLAPIMCRLPSDLGLLSHISSGWQLLRSDPHRLLQVNASPSLSATTPSDRILKSKVIHDTLQLATPVEWGGSGAAGVASSACNPTPRPASASSMRSAGGDAGPFRCG